MYLTENLEEHNRSPLTFVQCAVEVYNLQFPSLIRWQYRRWQLASPLAENRAGCSLLLWVWTGWKLVLSTPNMVFLDWSAWGHTALTAPCGSEKAKENRARLERGWPSRKIISNLVLIDTDNPPIGYAIQREDGGRRKDHRLNIRAEKWAETHREYSRKHSHWHHLVLDRSCKPEHFKSTFTFELKYFQLSSHPRILIKHS